MIAQNTGFLGMLAAMEMASAASTKAQGGDYQPAVRKASQYRKLAHIKNGGTQTP